MPKKFRVQNNVIFFVRLDIWVKLGEIVLTHDLGKIVLPLFSQTFGLLYLWPQSTNHVLGLSASKTEKNIL